MLNAIEVRIAELEASNAAVRDVLIAVMVAIDHQSRGLAKSVILQAQAIADVGDRPPAEVRAVTRLLDEMRVALDAPAND